jgi:hypothetical protein
MRTFTRAIVVLIVFTASAAAQTTLTGKWQGQTPSGEPVTLDLIVKGASLTGTMTVNGSKASLENGKVTKTTFAFSVTMEGGPQAFAGEGATDEIKIWMEERGPSRAVVLKRAKAQQ